MNLDTVAAWDAKLGIRRTLVVAVTLWITFKSYFWAAEFAYFVAKQAAAAGGQLTNEAALATGAIILAVTGPISLLQKAVFESYIASKKDPAP